LFVVERDRGARCRHLMRRRRRRRRPLPRRGPGRVSHCAGSDGNAVTHGAAQHVNVRLTRPNGRVTLSVIDDGKGFDANRIGGLRGLGLINMRERARQLNGTFELHSEPGGGPRCGSRFRFDERCDRPQVNVSCSEHARANLPLRRTIGLGSRLRFSPRAALPMRDGAADRAKCVHCSRERLAAQPTCQLSPSDLVECGSLRRARPCSRCTTRADRHRAVQSIERTPSPFYQRPCRGPLFASQRTMTATQDATVGAQIYAIDKRTPRWARPFG